MPDSATPITQVIDEDKHLAGLLRRAQMLARLSADIRANLPGDLAKHAVLANVRGTVLVMQVDSPGWASRLRFQQSALLHFLLEKHKLPVKSLEIKVSDAQRYTGADKRSQPRMPTQAAQQLKSAADHINDASLSAALARLASR